jgi:hypothetical protein
VIEQTLLLAGDEREEFAGFGDDGEPIVRRAAEERFELRPLFDPAFPLFLDPASLFNPCLPEFDNALRCVPPSAQHLRRWIP